MGTSRYQRSTFHPHIFHKDSCLSSGKSKTLGGDVMLKPGTKIKMTMGYRGAKGVITEKIKSRFEFYAVKLENGINIIVGPSAFEEE
jgi:hypothetical protein